MEAFIWMFKNKDFKKHFLILTTCWVFFLIIFEVLSKLETLINPDSNHFNIMLIIVALALLFLIFAFAGYFWELTKKIINRSYEIQANHIYDGKVKRKYIVELPEINMFKFAWRGVASTVATILMIIPYVTLVSISVLSGTSEAVPKQIFLFAYLLFTFMVPALLWNYAKTNSVFATINIRKAIYIIGNYTLRYIKTIFLLLLVFLFTNFIDALVLVGIIPMIKANLADGIKGILGQGFVFVYFTFASFRMLYLVYVNSYILGTMLPVEEY